MVEYVKNLAIPWEKLKKYRYPALILAVGLLLLLLPSGTKAAAAQPQTVQTAAETEDFDLEAFTAEAEKLLSEIQGAGKVRLLLTLDSGGAWSYLADTSETFGDTADQSQRQAVIVSRNGEEYPVTVTRTYPSFRGAVVVAEGGGASLTLQLKEAVSCLTGLGMDKITVLKSA